MLSVPVQKNIGEYREKIIGGLSWKMLGAISIGAVLCFIEGWVGINVLGLQIKHIGVPIMVTAAASFAFGRAKLLGLPFEKGLPLLVEHYVAPNAVTYQSTVGVRKAQEIAKCKQQHDKDKKDDKDVLEEEKKYGKLKRGKGYRAAELRIPRLAAIEREVLDEFDAPQTVVS